MKIKKLLKEIKKRENALANQRDKLDDLIDGLKDLREDCDEAWENLQSARDALSRLV